MNSALRRSLWRTLASAVLVVSLAAVVGPTSVSAQEPGAPTDDTAPALPSARYELMYTGEFIDQESEPISAVFPLRFKLYPSESSRKHVWEEAHYVSVVDGRYTVALGTQQVLPEEATRETLYLAVELNGTEVMRQPIRARLVSDEVRIGRFQSSGTADWAERAGDADTVGGISPDEFARVTQVSAIERQVQTLRAESAQKAKSGGGGGYLGGTNWQSQYAGGSGGKDYSLECPQGYVMTGVQGRSGAVVDALRIVCQKLE